MEMEPPIILCHLRPFLSRYTPRIHHRKRKRKLLQHHRKHHTPHKHKHGSKYSLYPTNNTSTSKPHERTTGPLNGHSTSRVRVVRMLLAGLRALVPKTEVTVRRGRRGGVRRLLGMRIELVVLMLMSEMEEV